MSRLSRRRRSRKHRRSSRRSLVSGLSRDLRRQLRFEPLEDRRLLSAGGYPELPGMVLVDPVENQFAGQIVYLDFDGAEDVTYNGPVVVDGIDVPAFVAPGVLAGQEGQIIAGVVAQLEEAFAGTGVIFTTEQPAEGMEYSTIYIGGDDSAFEELGNFFGLAETIDIGNQSKTDDAFVFSNDVVEKTFPSTALSDAIEHEIGHLLGMRHIKESDAASLANYAAVEPNITSWVMSYNPKTTDDLAVFAYFSGQAEVSLLEYIEKMASTSLTFYWDVKVFDKWDIGIRRTELASWRYNTTISSWVDGEYTITKEYSPTKSRSIQISSASTAKDMVRYLGTPAGLDSNGDGWGDAGVAYIPLGQSSFKDNAYVEVRFSSVDAFFDYQSDWQKATFVFGGNSPYFDILDSNDDYANQVKHADFTTANSYSGEITPQEDVDV